MLHTTFLRLLIFRKSVFSLLTSTLFLCCTSTMAQTDHSLCSPFIMTSLSHHGGGGGSSGSNMAAAPHARSHGHAPEAVVEHTYHDYSQLADEDTIAISLQQQQHHASYRMAVPTTGMPQQQQPFDESCFANLNFPDQFHYVLSEVEHDGLADIVSWQPHGRCFKVHKQKEFVETILCRWFRQTQFTSFQRQLNIYGFKRLTCGPDKSAYYHEKFLRGKPLLVRQIPRLKVKGQGPRRASLHFTEPNFYSMPFLPPIPSRRITITNSVVQQHTSTSIASSAAPTMAATTASTFPPPAFVIAPMMASDAATTTMSTNVTMPTSPLLGQQGNNSSAMVSTATATSTGPTPLSTTNPTSMLFPSSPGNGTGATTSSIAAVDDDETGGVHVVSTATSMPVDASSATSSLESIRNALAASEAALHPTNNFLPVTATPTAATVAPVPNSTAAASSTALVAPAITTTGATTNSTDWTLSQQYQATMALLQQMAANQLEQQRRQQLQQWAHEQQQQRALLLLQSLLGLTTSTGATATATATNVQSVPLSFPLSGMNGTASTPATSTATTTASTTATAATTAVGSSAAPPPTAPPVALQPATNPNSLLFPPFQVQPQQQPLEAAASAPSSGTSLPIHGTNSSTNNNSGSSNNPSTTLMNHASNDAQQDSTALALALIRHAVHIANQS